MVNFVDEKDVKIIPIPNPKQVMDISNQKYGRLTVMGYAGTIPKHTVWYAKCDCGKIITVTSNNLRRGNTTSCGCYKTEIHTKHGHNKQDGRSTEYITWDSMIGRCMRPNAAGYKNYGGRGITVCERWMKFENFLEDMGRKPDPLCQIDRIDNNGIYEPGNCQWSTPKENARNKRNTKYFTYNATSGLVEEGTLGFFAEKYGIKFETLRARVERMGMTMEEAIKKPLQQGVRFRK